MIALNVLGLLALVAIAAGSGEERIAGKIATRPGRAAHFVNIHTRNSYCNGALLNPRWIVTTARYFANTRPNQVTVWVGSTNQTDGTRYGVLHIVTHPEYNLKTIAHNIALLHAAKPITLVPGRVNPIALPRESPRIPAKLWTVLFGRNKESWKIVLVAIESLALSRDVCLRRINRRARRFFHADHVCAVPVYAGSGTCSGDSGAPLSDAENVLVGINSWASSCGTGKPDVYILVHPNLDFIRKTTGIQQ